MAWPRSAARTRRYLSRFANTEAAGDMTARGLRRSRGSQPAEDRCYRPAVASRRSLGISFLGSTKGSVTTFARWRRCSG